jgi:hypothetical protein
VSEVGAPELLQAWLLDPEFDWELRLAMKAVVRTYCVYDDFRSSSGMSV